MIAGHATTRRLLPMLFGLLAVVAILSQVALGGTVLPDDTEAVGQIAAWQALAVDCRTPVPAHGGRPAPHRHHAPDSAALPLSVALALSAAVLTPAPPQPGPATVAVLLRLATALTARGPPSHLSSLGFPRGPPVLA